MSVLDRVALEQAKVTVVAFYNGAKPVVVDAEDPNVVRNILADLPLDYAFDLGKTNLFAGLTEAFNIAKPWREKSATLFVVSDGDTVPEAGMPVPPPSIGRVIVLGVGDSRVGKFIDGHQSRQDAATLRQVAARLHGVYHDGNEKHLPSQFIADLAQALPLREDTKAGKRELAICATAAGAFLVAAVPVALALAGTGWRPGRRIAGNPTSQAPNPKQAERTKEEKLETGAALSRFEVSSSCL
jgi:Ca-activated chloride channel family protein